MELSVLELFVLSCLARGMETGYDLLRHCGLSLGATNPALGRLTKGGFVSRAVGKTTSARPRFAFKLTAKGAREAKSGWQRYLEQAPDELDIESCMRVVDMAARAGTSPATIVSFLRKTSSTRADQVKRLTWEAGLQTRLGKLEYPLLKLRFEAARLQSEAEALDQLAQSLKTKAKSRTKTQIQYVQQTLSGLAQKGH